MTNSNLFEENYKERFLILRTILNTLRSEGTISDVTYGLISDNLKEIEKCSSKTIIINEFIKEIISEKNRKEGPVLSALSQTHGLIQTFYEKAFDNFVIRISAK